MSLRGMGLSHESGREGTTVALEAAFQLGDHEALQGLLDHIDGIPRGMLPPYLVAQSTRYKAKLAAARGDDAPVEQGFKGAAGLFREIAAPFHMAVTLLDLGEWLAEHGRIDEAKPSLDEAAAIFEELEARPWLERLAKVLPEREVTPA
jgi:hypothetical protein